MLIQGGAVGPRGPARPLRAEVFATGSARNRAFVRAAAGATPIERETQVRGVCCRARPSFDVVYDTVGGAVLDPSFKAVGRFGHVVSALGWGWNHLLAPLSFRAATYSGVFTLLPMLTSKGRARHGK